MQTPNVSQPIEYAVSLPSCRVNTIAWYKVNLCKGVGGERIRYKIISLAIRFYFLRSDTKEICLLLLTILEPVSLILNGIHIDSNILLLGEAFIKIEFSLVKFRLFD